MPITFPAALLFALAGQAASMPMELPRLPTYTSTMSVACGLHKYLVEIENRGFTSELTLSQSNGKPVLFKTAAGERMADLIAGMHSVSVQPASCRPDGSINLAIRGLDMRAQSETRGKETIIFVGSSPAN